MAAALPFDEMLETASIPKIYEVKNSATGMATCKFTVINYRDHQTHEIEVWITDLKKVIYTGGLWEGEFRLEAQIVKIDEKEWHPPSNHCDIRFFEGKPRECGLEVHTSWGNPAVDQAIAVLRAGARRMSPRQDSVTDQLSDVIRAAERDLGCYDAADWIRARMR